METRYQVVVKLLNDDSHKINKKLTLEEISKKADVGYRWLCKLKNADQTRPGSDEIDKVLAVFDPKKAGCEATDTISRPTTLKRGHILKKTEVSV